MRLLIPLGMLVAVQPFDASQLRRWRQSIDATQREAARALGVHVRTFKAWELGERPVRRRVVVALGQAASLIRGARRAAASAASRRRRAVYAELMAEQRAERARLRRKGSKGAAWW